MALVAEYEAAAFQGSDNYARRLSHRNRVQGVQTCAEPSSVLVGRANDGRDRKQSARFCYADRPISRHRQEKWGGITGNELIRRFHLLDLESKNAIDFYFLGWRWRNEIDHSKGIRFDLHSFEECRNALRDIGVKTPFGGSADLILVDLRYRYRNGPRDADGLPAYYGYTELDLNFPEAIQINLATSRDKGEIPPLGDFLQSIIEVAESLHERGDNQSPVYSISDKLGIATAKRSFLDFILKKWGGIIGADKLAPLAVRNLGPAAYIYAESAKDNVLAVGGDLQALPVSPRG